jgi:hypothetical protein
VTDVANAAPRIGGLPLLDSKQLASFVARGFLRFDEIVPPALCEEALAELAGGGRPSGFQAGRGEPAARAAGQPLDAVWPDRRGAAAVVRLPAIAGIIESLLGPRPLYDHHYAHVIQPHQRWSQPWHADAVVDPRRRAFDIQLFFFFQETPRPMGGTMLLPGSHLRRVNESDIARYHNFAGQLPMVCPAGSLLVCHHGLWHCGQPNLTAARRPMLKLRLNPSSPQRRRWNTSDLDDPATAPATLAEVSELLSRPEPWHGNEARLEVVNRIKLWRHLTGDACFDVDYWLTRIENQVDP